MNKLKIIAIAVVALIMFSHTSCEEEKTFPVERTYSWLPVTDFNDRPVSGLYSTGTTAEFLLRLQYYDDEQISKVTLYAAEYDEANGTASNQEKVEEYSSFTRNEVLLQDELKISYLVPEKYVNKSVILTVDIESSKGNKQSEEIAVFKAVPFLYMIDGSMPYFYMGDNAGSTEFSAGYTCIVMLMHYYGGFGEYEPKKDANMYELSGTIENYNSDWIVGFYGAGSSNTVDGINTVFNTDAWWYGAPKRIKGTTTASFSDIEDELKAGRPVILHGNFMNQDFKHQVVVAALDMNKSIVGVMDPRGEWDGNVKGTYTENATAGNFVTYSLDDVKAAIGNDGAISINTIDIDASLK